MISGKSFRSRVCLALLTALPTLTVEPADLSLQEILIPSGRSMTLRYREKKSLPILDQTLTSSGLLHFDPPDTLVREVDGSRNTVYRIEGSQVSISEDGKILRQLDLRATPELAGFATILRALLAADIEALKKQYTLTVAGTADSWTLQLTSRSEPISRFIERISIEGGDGQIRLIDTYEQGGSHSRMNLMPDE